MASRALLFDEWLVRELAVAGAPEVFSGEERGSLLVHAHCHQKALAGFGQTLAVLRAAGYAAELIDSGCCGMAGSFGFEAEHYEMSQAMGELRLFPAIRAAGGDAGGDHGGVVSAADRALHGGASASCGGVVGGGVGVGGADCVLDSEGPDYAPHSMWGAWCQGAESNCRHHDFQSCALPTELPWHGWDSIQRDGGLGSGL